MARIPAAGFHVLVPTRQWAVPVVLLLLTISLTAAPEKPSVRADQGRDHWAFQPLSRPAVPSVKDAARVRTPIDAFVLAKLEANSLSLSPDADRLTLIRRAYLDLLGLPPTPQEVEAFLTDPKADGYERLLDRLLASPHFGERWGRHWLDAAGYVDVIGGDNDAATVKLGENKWLYRDYVIHSFNADKPFDQFLTEQIAGDESCDWRSAATFSPETRERLIATGFLRVAADDTDENELNTLDIRHGVLQRTAETLASNLLGLTLSCAKCHDHKFEPIPQRDYYQMLALIQPAFNPASWLQPKQRQLADVAPVEKAAIERHNAEIDGSVAPIEAQLRAYQTQKLARLSGVVEDPVMIPLLVKIAELRRQKRSHGHWQVTYDSGPPTPTHILKRGDHLSPGTEVRPGFLGILCETETSAARAEVTKADTTSGRRLALARWLTDANSPAGALVLRVRVNRVWQQLLGRGIVATSDNLGLTGAAPSHPELLDWLARQFIADGQRLKPFLKRIMLSTVYRQESASAKREPDPASIDPENSLFWRQRLRRLESETIRDRILAVSGKLDRTLGGPPIPVEARPDGMVLIKEDGLPTPTSRYRRSLYLLSRRHYHPTLLNVFDQPNLATNCTARGSSAVVLQSLTMLNDRFVIEQAGILAERVAKAATDASPAKRVEAAFRLALSRPPTPLEVAWCADLLDRHIEHYRNGNSAPGAADRADLQALTQLCHVLLNTSEFLYIP